MNETLASRLFGVVLFVAWFGTITAFPQATASLRGTISDPSGAVIPGAAITIKSADNGTSRRTATDAQGEYSFLQVAPGTYKLMVEKPGFATMTKGETALLVNTPATLDLRMSLSTAGEVVSVESDASQINTTDASVGNPFSETQVRQLPLQTRNVVELLSLQPGVTTDGARCQRALSRCSGRQHWGSAGGGQRGQRNAGAYARQDQSYKAIERRGDRRLQSHREDA